VNACLKADAERKATENSAQATNLRANEAGLRQPKEIRAVVERLEEQIKSQFSCFTPPDTPVS
jgi:hypothetical protein